MLAANVSGPRRLGFGTLRDYVIGISTINDEGQEVKAGGRVVKNVAGYDLCKLHIGALGTLGITGQVTLKLRPLPECAAFVTFGCESAGWAACSIVCMRRGTRPVCLDLLNQSAVRVAGRRSRLDTCRRRPWVIVVGFEDNGDAVGWQVRQLLQELRPATSRDWRHKAGDASEPLWRRPRRTHSERGLSVLSGGLRPPLRSIDFKANLLPRAVAAFCLQAEALEKSMRLHAHAGSGIVHGHLDGDLTLAQVAAMLKELTDTAVLPRAISLCRVAPWNGSASCPYGAENAAISG